MKLTPALRRGLLDQIDAVRKRLAFDDDDDDEDAGDEDDGFPPQIPCTFAGLVIVLSVTSDRTGLRDDQIFATGAPNMLLPMIEKTEEIVQNRAIEQMHDRALAKMAERTNERGKEAEAGAIDFSSQEAFEALKRGRAMLGKGEAPIAKEKHRKGDKRGRKGRAPLSIIPGGKKD